MIISVGTFNFGSKTVHLLFHHNIGKSQTEYIENDELEKVLEIAGWDNHSSTNKIATLDDIFMNLKSYKKWTIHGYGSMKFYVGLDLGNELTRNLYKDYVLVGQEGNSITVRNLFHFLLSQNVLG